MTLPIIDILANSVVAALNVTNKYLAGRGDGINPSGSAFGAGSFNVSAATTVSIIGINMPTRSFNNTTTMNRQILTGIVLASLATANLISSAAGQDRNIQIEAQEMTPDSANAQVQAAVITDTNMNIPAPRVLKTRVVSPTSAMHSVSAPPSLDTLFATARQRMVSEQLGARGIGNSSVLNAMGTIPRHQFAYSESLADAYQDESLYIGTNRVLASPYIIASVAQQLTTDPNFSNFRVLQIVNHWGRS